MTFSYLFTERTNKIFFHTYQKYLGVFICRSIWRMQTVRTALQFSRQSLLKDNKWLHGETAIEILSVCDIKNNWTNRDKGQIGFKTDIFFFLRCKRKTNECTSRTYTWRFMISLHGVPQCTQVSFRSATRSPTQINTIHSRITSLN